MMWRPGIATLALLAIFLVSTPTAAQPSKWIEDGQTAHLAGDYAGAVTHYNDALGDSRLSNIQRITTLWYRSQAQFKLGRTDAGIVDLTEALDLASRTSDASNDLRAAIHIGRARGHSVMGNRLEMAADLKRASDLRQGDPKLLYIIARIKAEDDQVDDALQYINQSISLSPENLNFLLFRAVLFEMKGMRPEMLNDLRSGFRLDRENNTLLGIMNRNGISPEDFRKNK